MLSKLQKNKNYPLLQSVIQKNMEGKIYTSNDRSKTLIINSLNWIYIIEYGIDSEFDEKIIQILKESNNRNYIWFGMTKYWEELIGNISKNIIEHYPRFEWKFDCNIFSKIEIESEKFLVKKIDRSNIDIVCEGIENSIMDFWTTRENFLINGFGYFIEHENKIIGLIISAGIYAGEIEIDIVVDNHYRRQGLGKLLSTIFIKECLKRKYIPKWDCYKYNGGSVKLAESLGFKVINEYPCNLIKL